ncbi:MAG: hypothetical protein GTN89_14235 [Acidobacteria bacterium]|nr:hypothetical protein [Acidobacteriota bacterium]NIM61169.1 hypothetical protein [Acidobacteriota bacterium]NIO58732.1 hypothetical protein [Acidobacteriota bacterium]NIQ31493.1 hypothetical protein [Acidobacteriota bacterium]NIQ84506.1 hypothetical protein [Acidobacteriota bacterium]
MQVKYKFYRGLLASWDELFAQAAEFAQGLGAERLINISHANSGGDGTVTVWYWADEGASEEEGEDQRFSRFRRTIE